MKSIKILLFALFLFSFVQATTLSGDGSHKMYIGDNIVSSNDFSVLLKNITIGYDKRQVAFLDAAVYKITYGGLFLETFTLQAGQSQSLSIDSGHKNVTVTADALAYDPAIKSAIAYFPPKPYVNTTVESETYVPPPPDVKINSISATTGKFWADISWTTNNSANATLSIYNESPKALIKTITINTKSTGHSSNVTGLKSGTDYLAKVRACTDNSCADSNELGFTTLPVIPVITDVSVDGTTNDTAIISWKTDVVSDSKVYYRELGKTEWERVPPVLSWVLIQKFFIFNFSDEMQTTSGNVASFSGKGGSEASLASASIPIQSYDIGGITLPGDYSIQSDYLNILSNQDAVIAILKQSHSIKLYDLKPETTYQYKVSSCADACKNSSIGTFQTVFTVKTPYANIISAPSTINHGTSAVITLSAYGRNPGAKLTGVKLEWNDGGPRTAFPVFGGDTKSFISNTWPTLSVVSITFTNPGSHQVTLTVTDNYSKTSTDTVTINVNSKTKCTSTSAIYYPSDTSCTNKWPNSGGAGINYNNGIGACHAFEVCDNNLDYMNADAESCCNGLGSYSSSPTKNRGYNYDKSAACTSAIATTRSKGPMTSLTSESSMKMCKAAYLVYSVGSQAVYMKDYYTAEACCKDASFCGSDYPRFQSWNPWPQSNIKYNELWCYWYDYGIFGKYARDGWYGSDTNPESNNNALADFPAHASVNTMNTGTCVDYSFVVTTALRKSGFNKNEIMSMRTPGHLYNVVWLPGDSKYSFIDTVGNNGGDFFTGPGWGWTAGGANRDHCGYNSDKCSNDNGMKNCPAKSQVYGC